MVVADALEFRFGGVIVVRVDAPLLHVSEERLEGVEVGGLDRIKLMVMAFGATEGAAQPGVGDRAHAFGAVFREIFLHLGAAFAGHHVQAIITARDELFFGRIRQEVAGELLAGEDVERLVGVEGVDDVIAIREDALILVAVITDRVGEAGDIEPPHRHPFAEGRRGEQAVDLFLVGIRRAVGQEGGGLGGRGWQAGQIERRTAEQAFFGSFRGRGDLLLGELGADEGVDRILASGRQGGDGGQLQRLVGPVRFVDGALGDPAAEEFFLRGAQGLVRLLFGHDVFGIRREDALDDLALVRFARHDRDLAALAGFERFFPDIQAESALARLRVEAVAVETRVGHQRTDVPVEADGLRGAVGGQEAGGDEGANERRKAHRGCRYDTPDADGFQSISRRIP